MIARAAGLVLHPTSLPGPCGIGDFGPGAARFLDWAASAGQSVWQVLPLGPTGYGDSPYLSQSSFGGNPFLVSPERLREEDLLPEGALEDAPRFRDEEVEFPSVVSWKTQLLQASFERFRRSAPPALRARFEAFVEDPAQADWLEDWALFSALKDRYGGREWTRWDRELVRREPGALDAARRDLADEILYHEYLQFLFFRQWESVRARGSAMGIRIMGDIPFYVAFDSADVWAHQRLFKLDESGRPLAVAGVPPDYFSKTGQLWGNPIYRWDVMEREGFAWWLSRLRANLRLADFVRLDHFRGFAAFWEVPAGEPTAEKGEWVEGPGEKLFQAIRAALGDVPLVAEDLGLITPDVAALRKEYGIPGMKVLQFAFGEPDSDYLPDAIGEESVVYTGTHDNDTSRGWFASLLEEERKGILEVLGTDGREIEWDLLRAAYGSKAQLAMAPVQDVLGLGSEARMNTPGLESGNWAWRALPSAFTSERAARLRTLVEQSERTRRAP